MSTEWKYSISIITQDKATGNALANSIPGSSDDSNADHFSAAWKDSDDVIWYSSHSRMTQAGYDALAELLAGGGDGLALSHIQHGLADELPRHIDFIRSFNLTPYIEDDA